jgi:hypothetical protein
MAAINLLMTELDERTIADRVGIAHDEARMRYHLNSNTVQNFDEFRHIITDYYNYHYTNCVSRGGRLPASEAYGRAKELLEREYRKRNGDIVSAFNDAHDGTNGGMRNVLDTIADGLKAETIERYMAEVFDRYVTPNSWEDKVEMIRQFISYCGNMLSSSVVAGNPQRYAHDYSGLIRSYIDGLQRTSSMFRRM